MIKIIGYKQRVSLYLFLLLVVSCNSPLSKLEVALQFAGENRTELEKVLNFYSNSLADSLKLRAAEFLIENMPGHYSYSEADMDKINRYYDEIDSVAVLHREGRAEEGRHELFKSVTDGKEIGYRVVMDVKCITADYLIETIEHSFKVWQEGLWAKQVNFDEFCEYILPYKGAECQTLDNWREYLDTFAIKRLDELKYNSLTKNSTYDACKVVNEELKTALSPTIIGHETYMPVKRISSLLNIAYGTCEAYTLLATSVMRAKGIPVVVDYTPQWPFRKQGHRWSVLLDNFGKNIIFEGCYSAPGMPHKENHRMAKVFRETYAINEEMKSIFVAEKYLPAAFRHYFMKDVTEEYMATIDITLPIKTKVPYDYAYLAVFDDKDWIPIHWGKIEKGKVVFEKMGKNIVYLPVFYGENGVIPFHDPILVTSVGEIIPIKADLAQSQTLTLFRKYPVLYETFIAGRTVGGKFQAADNPSFNNPVTLHTITDYGVNTGEVRFDSIPSAYRYWRYYSPKDAFCTMGEIQFYQKGNKKPIYGEVIGTEGSFGGNKNNTREAVFDGDVLTFFDAPEGSDCWVGMDFGKPVNIEKIIYYSRSDGNYIEIGDEYELVHWRDNGWWSLGYEIANRSYLTFEDCPIGGLFLLRNLTKGKDERIFTYENGVQVWW